MTENKSIIPIYLYKKHQQSTLYSREEAKLEKHSNKINKPRGSNIPLKKLTEMIDSNELKKIIKEGSETNKVALRCNEVIAIEILKNLKENNNDNDNIELCYNFKKGSAYFREKSTNSETELEYHTNHNYYKIELSNEYDYLDDLLL